MIFLLKNIDRRNYNETKKQSKDHAPTLHSPHGQDNDAHHHEHKDDQPIHHHRHQHRRPVRPGIASVGKINKRRARVRRLGREGRKPEKKQEEISILGVIGKELLHMDVKEFHQNKEPKKVERLAVFKRADQKPETNHGWHVGETETGASTTTTTGQPSTSSMQNVESNDPKG
uniref:Uncharacterized protein n=1 Tax=Ascaris lumbricoides TaxID=6252 RepID=A0A0M3I8E9_ASCLU